MPTTTLTSKGQVTIPKAVRDFLRVGVGDRLDFIINNACQTVRRPPDFYEHMMDRERGLESLPDSSRRLLGPCHGVRGTLPN